MNDLAIPIVGYETIGSSQPEHRAFRSFDRGTATSDERSGSLLVEREHPVWVLQSAARLISLKKPLVLRVYRESGRYCAEHVGLDICGFGDSPSQAIQDAIDDIGYIHDYYVNLPDEELLESGLELKHRLQQLG